MPRMIKYKENFCLGGKTRRKNYLEEKIRGKDGAKPTILVSYYQRGVIRSDMTKVR